MKKIVRIFIFLVLTIIIHSCSKSGHHETKKVFIVHPAQFHDELSFPGIVQPINENVIASPVDGVLTKIHHPFGQKVKEGEVIFTIYSSSLQKQYNDALTEYLKAKDNFTITKTKFMGTEDLWNAGIIAKNNYLSEKSNLNTAHVAFMQTWRTLSSLLEQTGDPNTEKLSKLNLAEFEKVQEALGSQHNQIQLRAPISGVILYAHPSSGDAKATRLAVGNNIKSGEVLASVGDLSGVRIEIDIPEVDIGKVHPNLPAIVNGVAFNHQQLQGKLKSITSQATLSNNGTLPSFQAVVVVNSLNEKQQSWIKIGMSANVEININGTTQFMIPIDAVQLVNGQSIVNIRTPDGKITQRTIKTGSAKTSMVSVIHGLNNGDVLIYE